MRCALNGILLSKDKFKFCKDTVQFGGLQITSSGVSPSESMLNAILDFPVPKTITDAKSWFNLVDQLARAYSLSPIMLLFRDLVKKSSRFCWNQTSEKAFQESKQVVVKLVSQGVSTFDINRVTCLAPDRSKDGMGFLLLQKHCACSIAEPRSVVLKDGSLYLLEADFVLMLNRDMHLYKVKQQLSGGHLKSDACSYWVAPTFKLWLTTSRSKGFLQPTPIPTQRKKLEISFRHSTLHWKMA